MPRGPPSHATTILRPVSPPLLQRLVLYQSKARYHLLGYAGDDASCRLLSFSRGQPFTAEPPSEDPKSYTPEEARAHLQALHKQSFADGGLQVMCEAYGLLGCFRFLEGHYLLLITKRRPLGSLCGHQVYGVAETALVPIENPVDCAAEKRYRKILQNGVDLTKDFFFSYTYNVCSTVQKNLMDPDCGDPFEDMFVWNGYLSRDLRLALFTSNWVVPLVHGFWEQRCMSVLGQLVTVTLVARRSRHFAGTRYLKRGINNKGWVANEVETEQIVSLGIDSSIRSPSLSSVVQLRGSIPLFWSQHSSPLHPRPTIVLSNNDPLYTATALHFQDLHERYSSPIIVLNLVKEKEKPKEKRETILGSELATALKYLNSQIPIEEDHIKWQAWDFKEHMKKDVRSFLKDMEPVIKDCLDSTGMCVVPMASRSELQDDPPKVQAQFQRGVVRSNCIDCLDRTNVCQYACGLAAMQHQLRALGMLTEGVELDTDSSLAYYVMEMYEKMGDRIALQYGGSEAHGTFFHRMRGASEVGAQTKEAVTNIKRFYSNAVTDEAKQKQQAINLLLGNFRPHPDKLALWELETDHYLHGMDGVVLPGMLPGMKGMPQHRSQSSTSCGSRAATVSPTSRSTTNVEVFKIPAVSDSGDNQWAGVMEGLTRGSRSDSGFFRFFKSSKDKALEFRLPQQETQLVFFEKKLEDQQIYHVRLHDNLRGGNRSLRRRSFQRSRSRMLDILADVPLLNSPPSTPRIPETEEVDGRHPSFTKRAKAGFQALAKAPKRLREIRLAEINPFPRPHSFSAVMRVPKLNLGGSTSPSPRNQPKNSQAPPVSAFAGKSQFEDAKEAHPQRRVHSSRTLRAFSTPAELPDEVVEAALRAGKGRCLEPGGNLCRAVLDELWSVTEASVNAEVMTSGVMIGAGDGFWDFVTESLGKWAEDAGIATMPCPGPVDPEADPRVQEPLGPPHSVSEGPVKLMEAPKDSTKRSMGLRPFLEPNVSSSRAAAAGFQQPTSSFQKRADGMWASDGRQPQHSGVDFFNIDQDDQADLEQLHRCSAWASGPVDELEVEELERLLTRTSEAFGRPSRGR